MLGHFCTGCELGHTVTVAVVVGRADPLAGEGALGHAREVARGRVAGLLGHVEPVVEVIGEEVLGDLGLRESDQATGLTRPETHIRLGFRLETHQARLRVFQEEVDKLLHGEGDVGALQGLDDDAEVLLVREDANLRVKRLHRLAALKRTAPFAAGTARTLPFRPLTARTTFATLGTLPTRFAVTARRAAFAAGFAIAVTARGTFATRTLFAPCALVVVLALVAADIIIGGLPRPSGGEIETDGLGLLCVAHCASLL